MKKIYGVVFLLGLIVIAGIYIDKKSSKGGKQIDSLLNLRGQDKAANTELKNYGPAPEFAGIAKWLNSNPLSIAQLRGKVVLLDFWTYSCINCIRTLPHVTKWYDTYKDQGFVIIGVHTPEFAFEKETPNVQDAIKRFHINYPVAQDNDYATWNNYSNRYWPAEYLIDEAGNIVYTHFGEGNYDKTENAIRELLGLNSQTHQTSRSQSQDVQSPEMYFGLTRLQNLTPGQAASPAAKSYTFPQDLTLNNFALQGTWQFTSQSIKLVTGQGKIRLKFHAGKVHLVAASQTEAQLHIRVDGKNLSEVTVRDSELYTLFDSEDYTDHVIEILIDEPDFEAFTFTFG